MTVYELMQALEECDPDDEVIVWDEQRAQYNDARVKRNPDGVSGLVEIL